MCYSVVTMKAETLSIIFVLSPLFILIALELTIITLNFYQKLICKARKSALS